MAILWCTVFRNPASRPGHARSARTGLPPVAVRGAGRLLGGITSSRLLTRLLARP